MLFNSWGAISQPVSVEQTTLLPASPALFISSPSKDNGLFTKLPGWNWPSLMIKKLENPSPSVIWRTPPKAGTSLTDLMLPAHRRVWGRVWQPAHGTAAPTRHYLLLQVLLWCWATSGTGQDTLAGRRDMVKLNGAIRDRGSRKEWRAAASSECYLDSLSTAALEETCIYFTMNYLRIIRNNIFRTKQCQILYCIWRKKARVNARHLDYNLFHPMYLQKWSLIWLTAVEISQQSHNSPVIESRAVKYYSNKSSKSPLKNCPCSGISHNHKGKELRKGQQEKRNDYSSERTTGWRPSTSQLVAKSWQGGKETRVMCYQKMLQKVSPWLINIERVSTFSL